MTDTEVFEGLMRRYVLGHLPQQDMEEMLSLIQSHPEVYRVYERLFQEVHGVDVDTYWNRLVRIRRERLCGQFAGTVVLFCIIFIEIILPLLKG